ncbi:hypothetical protein, partial [Klebsiella pneumoniae]|uniref:hypothetical protein n=1 Tax=Klebsiella pneumoniae TaxID=573 RepID=UPI0013D0BE41
SGLPVAVSGAWLGEDSLRIDYDEVGAINAYRILLRFTGKDVEVSLSERTQLIPQTRFRGTSSR